MRAFVYYLGLPCFALCGRVCAGNYAARLC